MRAIFPTILIIISVLAFIFFIKPEYENITVLKNDISVYEGYINDSTTLQEVKDSLVSSYKSISQENKEKLNKLLPDEVNNIKFVLEIENLASDYNLSVKNVNFESIESSSESKNGVSISKSDEENLSYGKFPIEFTISGSYESFALFIKELETNLRLVDVEEVTFSSSNKNNKLADSDNYEYILKVETYWLK